MSRCRQLAISCPTPMVEHWCRTSLPSRAPRVWGSQSWLPQAGLPNAAYFLPKLRILPKLWGGPPGPRGSPWTRFSPMKSASSTLRRADGGVGCGPGVRPTINAGCAVLGKACGIRLAACAAVGYRRCPVQVRWVPSGSGRLTIGRSLPSCPTTAPPALRTHTLRFEPSC